MTPRALRLPASAGAVLICAALAAAAPPATASTTTAPPATAEPTAREPAMDDAATGRATPAAPVSATPISYTLRFPAPETHRVEVEAVVPTGGADEVELMMAVWTPGSYLVREYARQVETISATDGAGAELAIAKSRKNRWRVATGGAEAVPDEVPDEVIVRYRLYCRELSVRTNFVDAGFALLNGAATFLTRVDDDAPADVPHRVRLELPDGWRRAVAALPEEDGAFVAADYDTLVDSPIYAGSPVVQQFEVSINREVAMSREVPSREVTSDGGAGQAGAEILLVHDGGDEVWDYERSRRDVEEIVATQAAFWGELPFRRYVFFNLIAEAGGGLEHEDSTVLLTSRWKARTEEGWRDWLGLVSHELFHAWNVKRLRPEALGPFDYEAENHTPSLWFVEGVTSYYDDLLVHRAGLSTREEYLETLGGVIESVQTTPGRLVQPLDEASYDAWIKYYRRDENSANRDVSYYRKGALVAWLLDARIRRATAGDASLDDLMRAAWRRWGSQGSDGSGSPGYSPGELLELVAEVADRETADWLTATLSEARELDYAPALEVFGLELVTKEEAGPEGGAAGGRKGTAGPTPGAAEASRETEAAVAAAATEGHDAGEESLSPEPPPGGPGAPSASSTATAEVAAHRAASDEGPSTGEAAEDAEETPAWLGAETKVDDGRLLVIAVPRGTPAFAAGVNVGDELLAIGDYRVPPAGLEERLKAYRPGDEVALLVARRERLTRLPITLGAEPEKSFYPRPVATAGAAAEARRAAWLDGR